MRDMYNNLLPAIAIAAAAYDADNTPDAVDLFEFDSALVEIGVGVGGITFSDTDKIEFVLTHSNDDSSYDAVELVDVQGPVSVADGIIKTLNSAHAAASLSRVGYVGGRRYLKLLADFSGTHGAATPIAASVIKGHPRRAPVA